MSEAKVPLEGVIVANPCGARVYAPGDDYFTCEVTAAHEWHEEQFWMGSPDDPIEMNGPGIQYDVVVRWRRRRVALDKARSVADAAPSVGSTRPPT